MARRNRRPRAEGEHPDREVAVALPPEETTVAPVAKPAESVAQQHDHSVPWACPYRGCDIVVLVPSNVRAHMEKHERRRVGNA